MTPRDISPPRASVSIPIGRVGGGRSSSLFPGHRAVRRGFVVVRWRAGFFLFGPRKYPVFIHTVGGTGYMLARMASPTTPVVHYTQVGSRWRASAQSALGPISAHGDSRGEARNALDQMLGIARAIEVTRNLAPGFKRRG